MDSTNLLHNHQSYQLLKIILDFIGTIMWPVTVLIIIYLFQQEIKELLLRARRIVLPGGISLETIESDILQAKALSIEVKNERTPEIQKKIKEALPSLQTDVNKKMIELGLTPSPSGLDINYYRKMVDTDPGHALIGLKGDLETMLKNLAKGFKIPSSNKTPSAKILAKLFDNRAITSKQFQFIQTLLKICNSAANGIIFTKEQALEVLDIADVLIKDYTAWLNWGFQ